MNLTLDFLQTTQLTNGDQYLLKKTTSWSDRDSCLW